MFDERKDHTATAGICARAKTLKKKKSYPKLQRNVLWCSKEEGKEYSFPSICIMTIKSWTYRKIINEPIRRCV